MAWLMIFFLGLVLLALSAGTEEPASVGRLEAKSPAFWHIVRPNSSIEKVADGFQFTEGPVWHRSGYLLFSDIPANTIYKWAPGQGVTVFRKPSGHSNGLTFDQKRRLVACEHSNRRVSRTEPDGEITVLADRYKGKRLNSPNDVVVKSDGSIYFTDPPYGIRPEEQEQPFNGVYRISKEGALTLLVSDFDRPNGLAFSPDEKYLYIADTARAHIRVFEVKPDGTLGRGRVFAEMKSQEPGAADGMKVDKEGNLYATGPGGVWVFSPSGEHLGTIKMPEVTANCAFGDRDGRTLYMTASKGLYRIRLRIPGIRP